MLYFIVFDYSFNLCLKGYCRLKCLNTKVDTPMYVATANPLPLYHSPRVKNLQLAFKRDITGCCVYIEHQEYNMVLCCSLNG